MWQIASVLKLDLIGRQDEGFATGVAAFLRRHVYKPKYSTMEPAATKSGLKPFPRAGRV
jgi:hypothetical protein